jgi:hypothetical protein
MSATLLRFRGPDAEELRSQLRVLVDSKRLSSRVVARIIGATSSEMFRFLKGEPTLTPTHLQALQTWRDDFRTTLRAIDTPQRFTDKIRQLAAVKPHAIAMLESVVDRLLVNDDDDLKGGA